ncbi:MAG: nucleotidyltransferase domain-containing protein [bacterium]
MPVYDIILKMMTQAQKIKDLRQEAKRIASVLSKSYQPEKIILFGSAVSGKVNEWSDLDIVVSEASPGVEAWGIFFKRYAFGEVSYPGSFIPECGDSGNSESGLKKVIV